MDGEIVQLRGRTRIDLTEATYFAVVRDKTSSLFAWAARAGAQVGGASADAKDALEEYGAHLGVAFQLVDDALDYSGDSGATGQGALRRPPRGEGHAPARARHRVGPGARPGRRARPRAATTPRRGGCWRRCSSRPPATVGPRSRASRRRWRWARCHACRRGFRGTSWRAWRASSHRAPPEEAEARPDVAQMEGAPMRLRPGETPARKRCHVADKPLLVVATPCFGGQVTSVYCDSLMRIQSACRASADWVQPWFLGSGGAMRSSPASAPT